MSSADRRDGQHDQKLLAIFNFHCAPPFPYWKSNVNCIGDLPWIISTFKSLTPSAARSFASVASSAALSLRVAGAAHRVAVLNFDGLGRHGAVFGKRQRQLPQNRQVAERVVDTTAGIAGFDSAPPASSPTFADMADHCERSRISSNLLEQKQSADNRHDSGGNRARSSAGGPTSISRQTVRSASASAAKIQTPAFVPPANAPPG